MVKAGSCSTYRANSGACSANGGDAPRNSGAATKPPAFAYAVRCFHRRVRRQRGRLQTSTLPPHVRNGDSGMRSAIAFWATTDGKRILLQSLPNRIIALREIFTIPSEGGVEEKLPFPSGYEGPTCRPDGQFPCYEPVGRAFTMWNKYRGGQTTNLALRCFRQQHRQGAAANTNDFNPMWARERVYFLSDRNGRPRLFCAYDIKSKAVREPSEPGLE